MERKYWRGRQLDLGDEEPDRDPLGPDERDLDLFEGWEPVPRQRRSVRGWRVAFAVLSILALLGMLVPMVLAITR